MTTTDSCNCDQAKAWETRALAAESEARSLRLSLRFARQQLERLLNRVDGAIALMPDEEIVHGIDGPIGVTTHVVAELVTEEDRQLDSMSWRNLATWMRDRLAAKGSNRA